MSKHCKFSDARSERAFQEIYGGRCRPRPTMREIRLPAIVSIERVATALGQSHAQVKKYVADKKVRTERVGNTTYIVGDDLRRVLAADCSDQLGS